MGTHLSAVRQRWEQNPQIFNELIRERLLDNPHRLTTILTPDRDMQARFDANVDERLRAIRAKLTDEQMKQIAVDAAELERLNEKPNSPEDLAKLPQLHISDLPKNHCIFLQLLRLLVDVLYFGTTFFKRCKLSRAKFRLARVTTTPLAVSTEIHRCYWQTRCR